MPKIIAKTSLIEQVKNLIKEEIASGILQPGQRIESIRSLLKKYKVSHITRGDRAETAERGRLDKLKSR